MLSYNRASYTCRVILRGGSGEYRVSKEKILDKLRKVTKGTNKDIRFFLPLSYAKITPLLRFTWTAS